VEALIWLFWCVGNWKGKSYKKGSGRAKTDFEQGRKNKTDPCLVIMGVVEAFIQILFLRVSAGKVSDLCTGGKTHVMKGGGEGMKE